MLDGPLPQGSCWTRVGSWLQDSQVGRRGSRPHGCPHPEAHPVGDGARGPGGGETCCPWAPGRAPPAFTLPRALCLRRWPGWPRAHRQHDARAAGMLSDPHARFSFSESLTFQQTFVQQENWEHVCWGESQRRERPRGKDQARRPHRTPHADAVSRPGWPCHGSGLVSGALLLRVCPRGAVIRPGLGSGAAPGQEQSFGAARPCLAHGCRPDTAPSQATGHLLPQPHGWPRPSRGCQPQKTCLSREMRGSVAAAAERAA